MSTWLAAIRMRSMIVRTANQSTRTRGQTHDGKSRTYFHLLLFTLVAGTIVYVTAFGAP
jgi:hypothetical protein